MSVLEKFFYFLLSQVDAHVLQSEKLPFLVI